MTNLQQVWRIRNFLTGQLFGAFLDAVPLIGLIPAMLMLEWRLALMAFALGGVIFVIVMVFLKPMGRLFHQVVIARAGEGLASESRPSTACGPSSRWRWKAGGAANGIAASLMRSRRSTPSA